jgi:uncharacterized membrane protein
MDPIHVHLLINHIPILGTLFGILILVAGLLRNNRTLIITALVTFIAAAIFTIPTNMSGEEAEHKVEKFAGVTHDAVEAHEHAAEPAFAALGILGVLSVITLFLTRGGKLKILPIIILLLSLPTFVLMVRAGYTGGQIRHPELAPGGMPTAAPVEHDAD